MRIYEIQQDVSYQFFLTQQEEEAIAFWLDSTPVLSAWRAVLAD